MFSRRVALIVSTAELFFAAAGVRAADAQAPDALIKQVSTDVLDTIKADKSIQTGDVNKVMALVDAKVMPHVNFQRMTASAVGRYWRQATPEQQKRLQDEFKVLLVRTYSGALAQVKDQTVSLKPSRGTPDDNEVVVRTEVRGARAAGRVPAPVAGLGQGLRHPQCAGQAGVAREALRGRRAVVVRR